MILARVRAGRAACLPSLACRAAHPLEPTALSEAPALRALGVPDVVTDAAPYFDVHHAANDTFDKVDPHLLRLNVAGLAVLAYLAAEAEDGFGRLPVASAAAH